MPAPVRRLAAALATLPLCGTIIGLPAPAPAADWSIFGSVSERIEAETNRDLEGEPEPVYGSKTSLGINATAVTPTTQWQILTGVTGAVFGGPGDTDGLTRIDPRFAAEVAHNGKYLDTGAQLDFDMQPVSVAQIEETGVTEGDASQLSLGLSADAAYALDPRNRLSLAGYGRIVRFTSGSTSLEPTTTYGTSLAWIRDFSAATQGSLTFGARRFTSDTVEDPESLTFDLSTGVSHAVNRRLSFDATLGITGTNTKRTVAGERDSEFSVGALAGVDVAWRPEPDTEFSFAFSHGLEPSTLGELQTTTRAGIEVQHEISDRVSTGITFAVQRRRPAGGFDSGSDRDFVRISPSIAFQLTPDWAVRAGYALIADREDGDEAVSNHVFLSVTREFDILP